MSQKTHNQGQTDASNGVHNRPRSHTEELFTVQKDELRKLNSDNRDYYAGRSNHKKQTS